MTEKQRRSTVNHSGSVRNAHAGTVEIVAGHPIEQDRGSEEVLLGFVHFAEFFYGQFYISGLTARCLSTMVLSGDTCHLLCTPSLGTKRRD